MDFAGKVADKFNKLMTERREYMDRELGKIRTWLNA